MTLKIKILLLALLPLIIISVAITTVHQRQIRELSEQEIATFERNLLASKKEELRHYVELALATTTGPLSMLDQGKSREWVEEEVKRKLTALSFGADGYFFAYSREGVNIVHRVQPYLIGQNLIDIQDSDGKYLIQNLLKRASEGGGFERYKWRKPSEGGQEDKLAYVVEIPRLGWMMGTGLYLDDITAEVAAIREDVQTNIESTFVTVIGIISITVILIILVGLIINIRESQLANQRLQELAQNSLKLQVNQRRTFARELHDGINQILVSTRMWMNLVDKKWQQDAGRAHLKKATDMLDQAIQEVRRVSHDLRPIVLDDLGLEAALRQMLKGIAERSEIKVSTRIHLDQALPDIVVTNIYRIVQEALTNIEKHSGATEIKLSLLEQGNVVSLRIEDNGKGFYNVRRGGLGLKNMRERTEILGGSFRINSYPRVPDISRSQLTSGTIISAVFYLEAVYQSSRDVEHES
ncbi:cache domain-containing protein [Parendozoicomonas haliclonae]|uniref:cache domain-containing protein n=1 Tax=Parendozoicomonas haliclonae TaxID=1960125 RepID=UPI001F61D9BA|nr:cache domain-containing protein [Parendozoicomonas haliclonae]